MLSSAAAYRNDFLKEGTNCQTLRSLTISIIYIIYFDPSLTLVVHDAPLALARCQT